MRVLVMEDDARLCAALARCLRHEGYAVDEVHDLASARAQVADVEYDCVLLDRRVPGGDGLELAAELYEGDAETPVLIMSDLGDPSARVAGLRSGADDYIAKPVDLDELCLRVRKLVVRRRTGSSHPIHLGAVTIDPSVRSVAIGDRALHLTPTQFSVLDHLVANRHRFVSSTELLDHVWDRNTDPLSGAVHSQISRLRRLFDGHLVIDRVREAGYVLRLADRPDDPGSDGTGSPEPGVDPPG